MYVYGVGGGMSSGFGGQQEECSVALCPLFFAGVLFDTERMKRWRKGVSRETTISRTTCALCAELQMSGGGGSF